MANLVTVFSGEAASALDADNLKEAADEQGDRARPDPEGRGAAAGSSQPVRRARQFIGTALTAGLGAAGVSVALQVRHRLGAGPATDAHLLPVDPSTCIPASRRSTRSSPASTTRSRRSRASASSGSSPRPRTSESTWDVYVGQTPFVEMSAMIKADVIEPWDNYIPKDVLDDIIPSIREEIHDRRQALWLAVPARRDRNWAGTRA